MRVRVRPPDLRRWLSFAALAVLTLGLPACTAASAPTTTPLQSQSPAQRAASAAKPLASAGVAETFDPAADFGAAPDVDLLTADGKSLNLARQKGKITLVYLTPW